jgi:hypothetical protein
MGQRRLTRWEIPRVLVPTGRLALSPVAVVIGLLVVTGASGYVSATSSRSPTADRGARSSVGVAGDVAGVAAPAAAGSGAIACPMIPASGDTSEGGESAGGDSVGSASHLFTRATADGITIRTYHLSSLGSCGCGSSDSVSVELSDQSAVGQGFLVDEPDPVATTGNARSEPIGLASGAFGVVEGAPVWWTAVAVGPEVATVSMTYPGGSTDQMAPVDGVAVLARSITASTAASGDGPYQVRGTLRLLDASGAVLTTVTLPESPPLPTPLRLPMSVPGNRAIPVIGTTSSSPPSSSAPSSSSAPLSSSTGISPPVGAGTTIACAEQVGPAASAGG